MIVIRRLDETLNRVGLKRMASVTLAAGAQREWLHVVVKGPPLLLLRPLPL